MMKRNEINQPSYYVTNTYRYFACFCGLYNIYDVQYADGQVSRLDPDEFLILISISQFPHHQEHIKKKTSTQSPKEMMERGRRERRS